MQRPRWSGSGGLTSNSTVARFPVHGVADWGAFRALTAFIRVDVSRRARWRASLRCLLPSEKSRQTMKSISIATAGATALVPLVLFLHTFSSSPLPQPAPFTGPLPSASPPPGMTVCALPTGVTQRVAAFAYRGGSLFERRDFSMAATLVKHPQGDLLIDTGFGRQIGEQFQTMPFLFRALTFYTLWQPAADQLTAAGYDPTALRAVLLTHAHWDHVSGLPDFPSVHVWVRRNTSSSAGQEAGISTGSSASRSPASSMKSTDSKGAVSRISWQPRRLW